MDVNSQKLKDALDALGVSLANGGAAIPLIQKRIDDATAAQGVPTAEVAALADQAAGFAVSFAGFVDSIVALEGTATTTATDTTPQP